MEHRQTDTSSHKMGTNGMDSWLFTRILIVTNLQLMLPIKIRIVSSVHLHLSKCNMLDLPENILGSADTENYLYFSVITVCIIYFAGKRWS